MNYLYPSYRIGSFICLKHATALAAILFVTMNTFSQGTTPTNSNPKTTASGSYGSTYNTSATSDDLFSANKSLLAMLSPDDTLNFTSRHNSKSEKSSILVCSDPSQSELRITIPDYWQRKSITFNLYNVHGSLVKQKIATNTSQTELFNISDLPVGIYIMKASNGDETAIRDIVKLNN